MQDDRLVRAFEAFDAYNSQDPNLEADGDQSVPKEVLYAQRMTRRLAAFAPEAPEHVQLAARCQHIGRWEIPRSRYPMDRKGYLTWRNELKRHHASIAERILKACGYEEATIELVKFLLLKKQLHVNPDTQLLEDIVCLVFLEHYLEDFASRHDSSKVVDILRKTMKKMSPRAIREAHDVVQSDRIRTLLEKAASNP
ncbi:MAG: DUF4202 domain-containing protein [Cyclobacteriaceae bacterium]|nr:DUF4202 domain-containing protein [Cyclobacteriaceae bacterium]